MATSTLLVMTDDPLSALVGVEEARLLMVDGDGIQGWVEAFDALSCRSQWHTPWG